MKRPSHLKRRKQERCWRNRAGVTDMRHWMTGMKAGEEDEEGSESEAITKEDVSEGKGWKDIVSENMSNSLDDPLRMYLTQIGEIPLFTRAEEIAAAKQIEQTRTYYRNSMLATSFMLESATTDLEKVYGGELRLDRTIEVSVTNTAEKKNIMRRLGSQYSNASSLTQREPTRFFGCHREEESKKERRAAWKRLVIRRNKAARLIEETQLRSGRLVPVYKKVQEISHKMQSLAEQIKKTREGGEHPGGRSIQELRSGLHYLMRISFESRATLARRGQKPMNINRNTTLPNFVWKREIFDSLFRSRRNTAIAACRSSILSRRATQG